METNQNKGSHTYETASGHFKTALEAAVYELTIESSAASNVDLISDLFYDWLLYDLEAGAEREVRQETTYVIRERHLARLFQTQRLIVNLVRIYEASDNIVPVVIAEKEVSNG